MSYLFGPTSVFSLQFGNLEDVLFDKDDIRHSTVDIRLYNVDCTDVVKLSTDHYNI